MIKSLLIANRGEIALRIARACAKMDVKPYFIFESADKDLPHAHLPNAYPISSYMDPSAIVNLAKKLNVEGIHPGYGFISEDPLFPKLTTEAGIEFVGPSYTTMSLLGNKHEMLKAARYANIQRIPGRFFNIQDIDGCVQYAQELGYPVLAKGKESAGGRTIKPSNNENELRELIAKFNENSEIDEIYISKFMTNVKHIEVQLIGDKKGHVLSVGTRDCSIQRRYQKLVEEAPSMLPLEIQREIELSAIRIGHLGNYVCAGTVEFLVDRHYNFYYMEVNPRLQVEHTVTEEVFGIDLVEWQLRLAGDEELNLSMEDLKPNGHAIQIRINAENPYEGFVGTTGLVNHYKPPTEEHQYKVRMETFLQSGLIIPAIYDSMIAKLIIHAPTRNQSISGVLQKLDEIQIDGIKTTIPLHKAIMKHKLFISTNHKTNYLDLYLDDLLSN